MANHPHNSRRPAPKAVLDAIANDDLEALLRALTVRQRRFAEEYVYDFNASAAAVRAGYTVKHVDKQAYNLLHHKGVAYYIDSLTKTKETNITVVDENYIVQKIVKTIDKAEEIVNLTAVLRGLELLARHKGMLTERHEISGPDGKAIEIEQRELQQKTSEFAERLRRMNENKKKEIVLV